MHQLISRPTLYLVIGIGVLALLVSQFRSTDNQTRNRVSELDPFSSLENLSGRNLARSTSGLEALPVPANVNPVAMVPNGLVHNDMVRDEMTSINSYQQTDAAMLNNDAVMAQPVEELNNFETTDSALQLADIDAVEAQVPAVNQIRAIDDSMTVLELDEPIAVDSNTTDQRYQLDNVTEAIADGADVIADGAEAIVDGAAELVDAAKDMVETNMPSIDSIALTEEPTTEVQPISEPTSVFEKNKARVMEENPMRPRGWRKNPFIVETKADSEPVEIETSSNESSIELDDTDSFSMTTTIATEMEEADQISTVGNFEPENAPSIVGVIPSTDQQMQSVMSGGQEFSQYNYSESLPIVIGLPESVAHKAVHNIEYGKSLSRRGAAFAARQEFYSSLRILAQAHDTQAGGTAYTRALRDAIIALKEAEDFIVSDTETQIGMNVGAVVEGHSTKLISVAEAANTTAIGAMQRYFGFASTQLRVASGQNPVAAEALYCLGKLHTVQAKFGANASKLDIAKSIVFHQAAMASDQTNFRSANELGVLMANSGRFQESPDMLKRSLQIKQLPQAWQNLAVVHQRAGQPQLAQLAQREFLIASRQNSTGATHNTIRWMNPEQFNQGTPLELRQGARQHTGLPVPPQNTVKPTISQRLKSLF